MSDERHWLTAAWEDGYATEEDAEIVDVQSSLEEAQQYAGAIWRELAESASYPEPYVAAALAFEAGRLMRATVGGFHVAIYGSDE